jgi:FKBP-type peptidyl-prolyl cis-trans isomerase SlyD
MSIAPGKEVAIEYTLKLDDQTLVESNVGSEPLTYKHGSSQIIPGLEKALEGMNIGDSRDVTVSPDEAYGTFNDKAFMEVGKEHIPDEAVKIGAQVQGKDPQGKAFIARISEVKNETVVLDFNHPLAGKTLFFNVRVLNIQ